MNKKGKKEGRYRGLLNDFIILSIGDFIVKVIIIRPEVEMAVAAVGKDDDFLFLFLFANQCKIYCGSDRMC